ncbi:hypothetical protein LTR33_015797, partial [Friedmanniomyces endolithicus]
MSHQRASSRHLRNRHGSQNSRIDDIGQRTPTERQNKYDEGTNLYPDEDYFDLSDTLEKGGDWSPAAIENGAAHKQAHLPPQQAPLSPPLTLPSGASTPNHYMTAQGNPVVTYPPPPPTWSNMPNK